MRMLGRLGLLLSLLVTACEYLNVAFVRGSRVGVVRTNGVTLEIVEVLAPQAATPAAKSSDEFPPSKANPHLPLPCQEALWRQDSTAQGCGP
jgi:hypothetical protein